MSGTDPCSSTMRNNPLCNRNYGESYKEVKRSQTPGQQVRSLASHPEKIGHAAAEVGNGILTHMAVESAAHAAETAGATAASGALAISGLAIVGYEVTTILYDLVIKRNMAEGRELNQALQRENRDMAILGVVHLTDPGAVPAAYHRNRASEVMKFANPTTHISTKTATDLIARASRGERDAVQLRDSVVRGFKQGQAEAYRAELNSPAALNQMMLNATFRNRYQMDPAFKQGVDSAVYQAGTDPDGFRKGLENARKTSAEMNQLRDQMGAFDASRRA